jgi:hypothetical protein
MDNELVNKFRAELKKSVVIHYNALKARFPIDRIYGYSLYTTDSIEGIGPVSNRESALKVGPSDPMYIYYRYSPDEWSDWDDFGMFDDVNKMIRQIADAADDNFDAFVDKMFEIMLWTLNELDKEGLFGIKDDSRFLVIWASDSANEIMDISAKTLNSTKAYSEYKTEF